MDKEQKLSNYNYNMLDIECVCFYITFIFVADVSKWMENSLIIIAISWIISGISNLVEYFGKRKKS